MTATLFAVTLMLCASTVQAQPLGMAAIGYRAELPSRATLTDPRTGTTYVVSVRPLPDVDGAVSVVDVILTSGAGHRQNLLEPRGIYHGLQPYDFAAPDFRNGAARSAFGTARRMTIRGMSSKLDVRIADIALRQLTNRPFGLNDTVEITSLRLTASLDR